MSHYTKAKSPEQLSNLFLQALILVPDNLRQLLQQARPVRLPPQKFTSTQRAPTRIHPPTQRLKTSVLLSTLQINRFSLCFRQVPQFCGSLGCRLCQLSPAVFAILSQVIGLGTPETVVSPACNCGLDEECVNIAQVMDVYIVPDGLPSSNDWAFLQSERYVGEFVDLTATL